MSKNIAIGAVIVALLLGVLAFSQLRTEPFEVSGFIEADEIRVGSRVGGRVAEVTDKAVEGESVSAGDILVRLEDFDLNERKAQAEARLKAARDDQRKLDNGFRAEERAQAAARVERIAAKLALLKAPPRDEDRRAAEAQVTLAEAQVQRAQNHYNRIRDLFVMEKGTVTRDQMDNAIEELKVAEAMKQVRIEELQVLIKGAREEEIDQVEAELKEAQAASDLAVAGYREEERAAAAAAVEAAKADVDVIVAQQQELTIVAPVDGVVEAIDLQPGDLAPASAPVVSLIDTSHLWVRAYVPENRLNIQLNQAVTISVDSFPEETFDGRITFIARQAEFTPSNIQTPEERSKQVFRIKVTIQSGLDKLRPGMAADIHF